ncbi:secreted RxLR effector protein 161-like [Xenia sp. Carnegie-2017]|uniref:secreted RxLR effector protein 161-like n=1 Tax=Xenia sp. Carnegie-2017 TaxID=2897299 RepID=UPI001F0398D9|nr:secreted RxLR effector protein 161-like [Xenia sp. Carnegie-2017]
MKDLGILHWFLGIEFKCSDDEMEMSQSRYAEKILAKFEMSDCKPKKAPSLLEHDKLMCMDSPELEDPNLYRRVVGSLNYFMTGLRPDLCYVVTKLSQYMSKPTVASLNAAKHVLRYLRGTPQLNLTFRKSENPLELVGYSDSDWRGNASHRKSISGYAFLLSEGGPLISWKSKKQQVVALSTCEAEYIAMAEAV